MRKIFLITERRADYSRFQPILKQIQTDKELEFDLVVTGLHLRRENGLTINEIISDGFEIFDTFEMFLEGNDSAGAMVRAYAEATKQVTYALERSSPDIILSGFDIAANAAVTLAGAHMNIPVAHIQGGEVTGTIDESIRHAMSKFAHYHFAANEDAKQRLIRMGELPNNVFNVGCPSIDAILAVPQDDDVLKKFSLKPPYFIMIQHPVTSEYEHSADQIAKTLKAIELSNEQFLIVLPNNDAGYSAIVSEITNASVKAVKTLTIHEYVNLLRNCEGLVGNSSSGIHEAATFDVPVVNVGSRQQGRLRPLNVMDVEHDVSQIVKAIKKCKSLREKKIKYDNPYGDGRSAQKIVSLLKEVSIDRSIIQKRITY